MNTVVAIIMFAVVSTLFLVSLGSAITLIDMKEKKEEKVKAMKEMFYIYGILSIFGTILFFFLGFYLLFWHIFTAPGGQ